MEAQAERFITGQERELGHSRQFYSAKLSDSDWAMLQDCPLLARAS
jgi:hypothetical protein